MLKYGLIELWKDSRLLAADTDGIGGAAKGLVLFYLFYLKDLSCPCDLEFYGNAI